MLIILFGYPGAGKTYTGNVLKEKFNFHFYDGDEALPEDMKRAINTQSFVTKKMRDEFFDNLLIKIEDLRKKYPHLVVAQTYIKEKYRKGVVEKYPDVKFILISTKNSLREKRLLSQKTYPLTLNYIRQMVENFDQPKIKYSTIFNNTDGDGDLKKELKLFLVKDNV